MTTKRPLAPVLWRMTLGLGLGVCGALLTLQGLVLEKIPGLEAASTPLSEPLDGPKPADMAKTANLRLEGDRTNLLLLSLPKGSPYLIRGKGKHRNINPVITKVSRQGSKVDFLAELYVKSLENRGVVVNKPEPYQHELRAALNQDIPLNLSLGTLEGKQMLDLQSLKIKNLSSHSYSGDINLTLPQGSSGAYSVVTKKGEVQVSSTAGSNLEAIRVNAQDGNVKLSLEGVKLEALSTNSTAGNIKLFMPKKVVRGSIATSSGNVFVKIKHGSSGNLDIRTQSGSVQLEIEKKSNVRMRFTDRDAIIIHPNSSPQLDIFIDTASGNFRFSELP